MRAVGIAAAAAMAAVATPALAAPPIEVEANTPAARASASMPAPSPPLRPLGIQVSLGTRSDLVRSAGLDPFSSTDRLAQPAVAVGYRFGAVDAAGLALAFEWNRASASATARAATADLTMDRLSIGLEARRPLLPRLAVFGRLAPGLIRVQARLHDASAPWPAYEPGGSSSLAQTTWAPAVDVGAGLAFRFADVRGPGTPSFSFWLVADGGYGWSPAHQLELRATSEAQPGRSDEPVRLGELAMRGVFARGRLAVSF